MLIRYTLRFDLKKIKLTSFDYNIFAGNEKDKILLQVHSKNEQKQKENDKITSYVDEKKEFEAEYAEIMVTDTDASIAYWKAQNLPVIAWSHDANAEESLMGASWMILELESLTEDYLNEIYCRFHHIPMTVCQTKRSYLRELTEDDLESLMILDREQALHSAGRFFQAEMIHDPQACHRYLKDYIEHQYPFYGFGIYGAFQKDNDVFLGIVGCSSTESSQIEIGYAVKRDYRRQGYAKEWIMALLKDMEERLEIEISEMVARIAPENEASIRTAAGCGIAISIVQ